MPDFIERGDGKPHVIYPRTSAAQMWDGITIVLVPASQPLWQGRLHEPLRRSFAYAQPVRPLLARHPT